MKQLHLLKQEFVWEEPSLFFPECHASTCLRNEQGDVLVAYFAGTEEKAPDVGIWISRRIGGKWQQPRRIKYLYGMPHWNPILHRDGEKVILYYKVGFNCSEWYTMVSESYDFGETWTESREAIEGDHTSRIVTKNRILIDDEGRWIAGSSAENAKYWDCSIEISEDQGRSWSIHPIPFTHIEIKEAREHGADGVIQPALWQSSPLDFHCLMRSSKGYIYRSDSGDGGQTWCEAYPISLPNNNSGISLVRTDGKRLVLAYNPVNANWGIRSPLSIAISEDNGGSWTKCLDLETEPAEFSYPYLQWDGETIDLVYTWKRKNIVHCEFVI